MRELQGLCDPTHTQIAHTFVRCSRIRKRKPTKEHRQDFLVEPRVDISPRCFPQRRTRHKPGSPTSHGSTYIEIHISPPCSNPRSAPPPRRGVFCWRGCRQPPMTEVPAKGGGACYGASVGLAERHPRGSVSLRVPFGD